MSTNTPRFNAATKKYPSAFVTEKGDYYRWPGDYCEPVSVVLQRYHDALAKLDKITEAMK
jgi:hypothetical protein